MEYSKREYTDLYRSDLESSPFKSSAFWKHQTSSNERRGGKTWHDSYHTEQNCCVHQQLCKEYREKLSNKTEEVTNLTILAVQRRNEINTLVHETSGLREELWRQITEKRVTLDEKERILNELKRTRQELTLITSRGERALERIKILEEERRKEVQDRRQYTLELDEVKREHSRFKERTNRTNSFHEERISILQKDLRAALMKETQHLRSINELELKLSRQSWELYDLRKVEQDYKKRMEELQTLQISTQDYMRKVSNLSSEVNRLEKELFHKEKEILQYKSTRGQMYGNGPHEERYASILQRYNSTSDDAKTIISRDQEMKREMEMLNFQLDKLREEKDLLNTRLKEAESNTTLFVKRCEEAERCLALKEREIQDISSMSSLLQSEKTELLLRIDDLEIQIGSFKKSNDEEHSVHYQQTYSDQELMKTQDIMFLQKQIEKLQEEKEHLARKCSDANTQASEMEKKHEELEEKYDNIVRNLQSEKERSEGFQRELISLQSENERLTENIRHLEGQRDRDLKREAEMERQLAEYRRAHHQAESVKDTAKENEKLLLKISTLESEVKGVRKVKLILENEKTDALLRMDEAEREKRHLLAESKYAARKIQLLEDKTDELQQKVSKLQLENGKLLHNLSELDKEKQESLKQLKELEEESLSRRYPEESTSTETIEREIEQHITRVRLLETEIKLHRKKNEELTSARHDAAHKIKELEKKERDSRIMYERTKTSLKENEREMQLMRRARTEVLKRLEEKEEKYSELKHLQKLAEAKLAEKDEEIRSLQEYVTTILMEKMKAMKERDEMEKAKEEALSRLSKAAGARLTQGNSAITDLSDDNRPTKIAEKFSEIYDNLWTDAYKELGGQGPDDQRIIAILLNILKDAYRECKEKELMYDSIIAEAVYTIPGEGQKSRQIQRSTQVRKAIVEIKQDLGINAGHIIVELFKPHLENLLQQSIPAFTSSSFPKTLEYCQQCTILCWLMRIRDPSVHIDFHFTKGTRFDGDVYRQYTKSGTRTDYLVWPILYQNEGGPLLVKGVAQPE